MENFTLELTSAALAEMRGAEAALKAVASVDSDAAARAADAAVKPAKSLVKIVHDQRMAISRRVDAAKKSLIARETEICAGLNAEIERVSSLCSGYLAAKAAAAEAERKAELDRIAERQARLDEAAAAESALTGAEVAAPVLATPDAAPAKPVAGVSSRERWAFDVVNADAVPRAYCSPDPVVIRAYVNEAKRCGADFSSLAIPGVAFRREFSV